MVIAGVVGKEDMLFLAPCSQIGFDMAVPYRRCLVRFCNIKIDLGLTFYAGTYIATAIKIYTNGIERVFQFGTFYLDLNLLLILLMKTSAGSYPSISFVFTDNVRSSSIR